MTSRANQSPRHAPQSGPAISIAGSSASPAGEESRDVGNVQLKDLNAYYGTNHAVRGVSLDFDADEVTAIIGPSGCGKSTMVRCINRMHEEIPGRRAEGEVLLDGLDLYDSAIDVVAVRRAVGMVFQKPNPFPTMSVIDNVTAGPAADRRLARRAGGPRARSAGRGRPLGRGQGPAQGAGRRASPAASSSASASPARSRSSPRCC